MSEPFRLVIWDLDETFWKGTLTEGGITEYVQAHHDIVVALAQRGIMSSICSKNDFDTVRRILQEKGIWDYFIFPSINWQPKGGRMQRLVEAVQLRAETVLFLDDNPGNRAEALAAVPGLRVADESVIATMLDDPLFSGKADHALSRLQQYKVLEQRTAAKVSLGDDNTAFLRESRIVVTIDYHVTHNIERAIELINRTNQLNFTKVRLPEDAQEARRHLLSQLQGFDVRTGLVSVRDRFGDYGICGFFLLSGHWGNTRLLHFAFSCRVLGMGIEQWVYHRLGRPELDIIGEVLADLSVDPDWINVADPQVAAQRNPRAAREIRIRGSCELEIIEHFFRLDSAHLLSEMVFWKEGLPMLKHHSALLYQSLQPQSSEIATAMAPFGAVAEVASRFLEPCSDGALLVYNNSMDTSRNVGLYRHKSLALRLPIWIPELDHIANRTAAEINAYSAQYRLDEAQTMRLHAIRDALVTDFEVVDEEDDATLREMYRAIVARVPRNALLVWLLPSPIVIDDRGQRLDDMRQKRLNAYVCEAAAGHANVVTLDMDSLVQADREVLSDGHFDRSVYHRLFLRLRDIHARWLSRGFPACG